VTIALRVDGGLHSDADVDLPAGTHVLGSGDDDDILLTDEGVVSGHLRIVVGDEGARVEALAGPVGLDDGAATLSPGDAWALGAGEQGLRVGQAHLRVLVEGLASGGATSQTSGWMRWLTAPLPSRAFLPVIAPVAMGALLVAGVLWTRQGAVPPAPRESGLEQLQAKLADHPSWGGVQASRAPDGRLLLTGTVADRRELQQLLHQPALAGDQRGEPAVRVLVKDELLRHVGQALQDPSLRLDFVPAAEHGLPELRVSGSTARAGVPALLKLLKTEWAQRVEIVDATAYEPPEGKRKTLRVELPIRIAAVNATQGFVEATNGRRYFVGSVIGPGQTLESIEEERVVFTVNGQRVPFQLP
jgi:hypothetical protein